MRYRHEQKYIINNNIKSILTARLSSVFDHDGNDNGDGYHIRSLYFDDKKDSGYYDKEDGHNLRGKFRIRLYNGNTDTIYLEKKIKNNGMCIKYRTIITEELANRLMSDDDYFIHENSDKLVNEFMIKKNLLKLKPKQIVDYTREAFVSNTGNIRITFDKDISAPISNDLYDFDSTYVNVLEKNTVIMEIKYDDFFPEYLGQILQMDYGQASSFSKYYECRNASKLIRRI